MLAHASYLESVSSAQATDGSFSKPLAPRDRQFVLPLRMADTDGAAGFTGVPLTQVPVPAPAVPVASSPSTGMQFPFMMYPPFTGTGMPPGFDWGSISGGRNGGGRGRGSWGRGGRGCGAASSASGAVPLADAGAGKSKKQERDATCSAALNEAKRAVMQ
jgi:hypothetical protein